MNLKSKVLLLVGKSVSSNIVYNALAKESVSVCLSADGGDEIFGGYSKYEVAINFFPKVKKIPTNVRKVLSKSMSIFNVREIELNYSIFEKIFEHTK